jgi:Fe-S-cluster formation regulator IscX/YfhJ
LDQAFLFERTIDIDTYDRHRDKLREELTLVQMDRHPAELEEFDVEGSRASEELLENVLRHLPFQLLFRLANLVACLLQYAVKTSEQSERQNDVFVVVFFVITPQVIRNTPDEFSDF